MYKVFVLAVKCMHKSAYCEYICTLHMFMNVNENVKMFVHLVWMSCACVKVWKKNYIWHLCMHINKVVIIWYERQTKKMKKYMHINSW